MSNNSFKDFKQEEEKGKIDRLVTIDWDLNYELRKRKSTLNVSKLVNNFLWYYIKKLEKDEKQEGDNNDKAGEGNDNKMQKMWKPI